MSIELLFQWEEDDRGDHMLFVGGSQTAQAYILTNGKPLGFLMLQLCLDPKNVLDMFIDDDDVDNLKRKIERAISLSIEMMLSSVPDPFRTFEIPEISNVIPFTGAKK